MPDELVLPGLSTTSDPSRRLESASAYHQVVPVSDEACHLDEPIPAHPAPAPRRHGAYERSLLAGDIQRGGGGGQSVEWFFDNIDHHGLMERVRRRVSDRKLNRLVVAFLKSGVMSELRMAELGSDATSRRRSADSDPDRSGEDREASA